MRYYDITISTSDGQILNTGSGLGFTYGTTGSTFTSYSNGQTDMGALQVEFDIPVSLIHQPSGQAWLRVWGVGLPMLNQAHQLAGMNIVIKAGMQKGLPLANPAQNGIIIEGKIFQSFGNWQGVNQTLEIVFYPQPFVPTNNVRWGWAANTPVQDALSLTVSQAFPGYTADTSNVTATLQQPSFDGGPYDSFTAWATHVQAITQALGIKSTGNANYPGVLMQLNSASKTVYFYDNLNNTSSVKQLQLQFQDFIGQPTWIGPSTINFKMVLRSDLNVGNTVKFPLGTQQPFALTQTVAAPGSPVSSQNAFQGNFSISRMEHFANFRQPDAESWNTTFEAFYIAPNS